MMPVAPQCAAVTVSVDGWACRQAVTARLNALENDNTAAEEVAAASDDEFDVDEESEEERSSEEEDMRLGCASNMRRPLSGSCVKSSLKNSGFVGVCGSCVLTSTLLAPALVDDKPQANQSHRDAVTRHHVHALEGSPNLFRHENMV